MAVHKIVVTTTVLVQADTLAEAVARVDGMDLDKLAHNMDVGDMIGDSMKITSSETIAPEKIEDETAAIGGDATFFADELPCDDPDDEEVA